MSRPNFLVIMTDQQRADHLGCYGNDIVRTPRIDALAARGTRFDRFYVANPICQPNRAALATGQLTSVNGCRQNGIPLGLDCTTYADVLRAAGYRTGLVGKAHFQNVSPVPARPAVPGGEGEAPPEPFDLARRSQRRGLEYEHEIRTRWIDVPGRDVPLPYYGFDHLRLCIGHGDQVEGHYTGWLRDRLDGAPDPRGRAAALGNGTGRRRRCGARRCPKTLYPTAYVGEEACRFLQDPSDDPFLLVASFPDPHHPFTPPGRYFDMYDPADIPLPESFGHPTAARTDLPASHPAGLRDRGRKPRCLLAVPQRRRGDAPDDRAQLRRDHHDRRLGRADPRRAGTKRQGGRTPWSVFMSDHGDYMGDHGTVLKHGLHSHGLIRVPLIWADPRTCGRIGVLAAGQCHRLRSHPAAKRRDACPVGMQGRDLLAPDAEDLPVLIEDAGLAFASDDGLTASRTLVHDGWRMTVFEGSELGELYDLGADPSELSNLWADPASAARKADHHAATRPTQIALRDTSLQPTHQA
jgi:arylsulfatase A-like enzyme